MIIKICMEQYKITQVPRNYEKVLFALVCGFNKKRYQNEYYLIYTRWRGECLYNSSNLKNYLTDCFDLERFRVCRYTLSLFLCSIVRKKVSCDNKNNMIIRWNTFSKIKISNSGQSTLETHCN